MIYDDVWGQDRLFSLKQKVFNQEAEILEMGIMVLLTFAFQIIEKGMSSKGRVKEKRI